MDIYHLTNDITENFQSIYMNIHFYSIIYYQEWRVKSLYWKKHDNGIF